MHVYIYRYIYIYICVCFCGVGGQNMERPKGSMQLASYLLSIHPSINPSIHPSIHLISLWSTFICIWASSCVLSNSRLESIRRGEAYETPGTLAAPAGATAAGPARCGRTWNPAWRPKALIIYSVTVMTNQLQLQRIALLKEPTSAR